MYITRIAEKLFQNILSTSKVAIVLGARQVGKTTLVKHVLGNNLKTATFLNLDIEADKQRFVSASSLSPSDALKSLGLPEIVVIDEAQRLPETGRIIKGWYDAGAPVKIVLLGSSSLDILDQTAESLTGRNEKLFLPPLLFREVIACQSWYSDIFSADTLQDDFKNQIQELLTQSLVFGNYPEVVQTADKQAYLLNLISDYLLKDILQMALVKTPEAVRRLLMLLAHQTGSEVSVNELANNLGISRLTVERYLELLERTFVIFTLPAFSSNPRKEITKSKKIYFWDTGIRNAILNDFSVNLLRADIGSLWENWVIAEFAKKNLMTGQKNNLYFWRSRAKGEVDLVIKGTDSLRAFEIKWQKRSGGQKAFSAAYGIKVAVIDHSHPLVD